MGKILVAVVDFFGDEEGIGVILPAKNGVGFCFLFSEDVGEAILGGEGAVVGEGVGLEVVDVVGGGTLIVFKGTDTFFKG